LTYFREIAGREEISTGSNFNSFNFYSTSKEPLPMTKEQSYKQTTKKSKFAIQA
jgi:hypothetical protein